MVSIVSGFGETAQSWANGLNDLQSSITTACPRWKVERYAHNQLSKMEADGDADTDSGAPAVLIGHSFGGCTCVLRARQLAKRGKPAIVILYDGVWWEGSGQLAKANQTITLPNNVIKARAFLRVGTFGGFFPCGIPIHFQIDPAQINDDIQCRTVPGVDHNTLVQDGEIRSESVILIRDEYRDWLRKLPREIDVT